MIRKRLGFSAPEWRALPWHDARLYSELLAEELAGESEARGEQVERVDAATADLGDMAAAGFRVQRV